MVHSSARQSLFKTILAPSPIRLSNKLIHLVVMEDRRRYLHPGNSDLVDSYNVYIQRTEVLDQVVLLSSWPQATGVMQPTLSVAIFTGQKKEGHSSSSCKEIKVLLPYPQKILTLSRNFQFKSQ